MKIVTIAAICVGISYHLFSSSISDKEVMLLKHETELYKGEAQILRDQIGDMTYQWSSKRTYEQGVADGLNHSKNDDWKNGYHYAVEQFATEDRVSSND